MYIYIYMAAQVHKSIVVLTGRAHCFHDYICITTILLHLASLMTTYICIYVCVYVYICIFMCMHIYIYIYIYIYI